MKRITLAGLMLSVLLLIGCETTTSDKGQQLAEARPGYLRDMKLIPGLHQDNILAHAGKPENRVRGTHQGEPADVWIYSELIGRSSTTEIVDLEEFTYVEQTTGGQRKAKLDVPGKVNIDTFWVTELIFVEKTLMAWNEGELERKSY